MIAVGVVAAGNGVAEARVLARTLGAQHPDWPVTVLVLPGVRGELDPGREPFEVLRPSGLAVEALDDLVASAPRGALAAAARPLLVRHLLARGAEHVVMLPPDGEVHSRLDPLVDALADNHAVLVPRLGGRLPDDGRRPDGHDLLEAGEIDDAVLAVRASDTGRDLVEWWAEQALEAAYAAAALSDAPADATARLGASVLSAPLRMFDGVTLAADPGLNVSYWNLHERLLTVVDGTLHADGRPLRLMRWAGYRADRPWWLSEDATRVLVLDDPVLTDATKARSKALWEAGWLRLDNVSEESGRLPNGVLYDERLRRLHAEATDAGEDFGDLQTPIGAEAFVEWLLEPAPSGVQVGMNRYAYDAWRERADVQSAYPNLNSDDGAGFVGWLWVHGREELGLQRTLLPPAPESSQSSAARVPSVLVAGYLRGHLGLGEAARSYVAALQAAGVPVATHTLSIDPPVERLPRGARPRPEERDFEPLALPPGTDPDVHLVVVNADQLPGFVDEFGGERLEDSYLIGQWAWETDHIPERWNRSFDLVDEIWAFSTYVADNIARSSSKPVVMVPLPVAPPDPQGATVPFELPDRFLFLFAFDFFSTLERKNPLGLVEAFTRAFEPGEGPVLVLKTINAEFRPEARERLRHAIGDRDDVLLVDRVLAPGEMAALFARADSYVSLHRSEGFGLTLAETMALGKPVIATGFSGNTDFMTPANSYLVDWRPASVGGDAEHYPSEGTWAEPDLEHAAELMREVWRDQAARARGARAAADIAANLSAEAVGRIARARLIRIAARRADAAGSAQLPTVADDLAPRLHFDLAGGAAASGVRGAARRGVFRALQPYSTAQRRLDEEIVETLRRLQVDLGAERAAARRGREAAARLHRRVEALEHEQRELGALRDALQGIDIERTRSELDAVLHGLRAIPFAAGDPFTAFDHPVAGRVLGVRGHGTVRDEEAYRAFEDVFRGSRERVAGLVEPYVELLADHAPVLDIGCGRGELLELLKDAGIEATGIDIDEGMAAEGRARGLAIEVGDAVEHLRAQPDGTLGAIVSIQVVEHLSLEGLRELFALSRVKLREGGLFVAETVNPHAAHALKTFWVDLTHRHPIFPEVALVQAVGAGFAEAFIWHPAGAGDVTADRFVQSSYALVATA
ncbi:methyltransferase domain-containing protein [Solirubrobacter taibaiensis]|nr:methyltransferase domain-containing protein [Solirubrobacter taibaiensis]